MSIINHLYYRVRILLASSYPHLFNFFEKRKAFVKFFIAGTFSGTVDLILLFIFLWDIIFSTSAAFILTFLVSFSLQKLWTFRNYSRKRLPRQLTLYLAGAFLNLNLNALAMHFLVNNLGVWYLLAQFAVNLILGFLNFLNYKFIVFKKDCHENKSFQKSVAGN
jgi:putative flippase GtrA